MAFCVSSLRIFYKERKREERRKKKNEMRRVYILKTRIGIKTNSSSICTVDSVEKKERNEKNKKRRMSWEYNNALKQMNVNGKDKHVSLINKANNAEESKGENFKYRENYKKDRIAPTLHWIDDDSLSYIQYLFL